MPWPIYLALKQLFPSGKRISLFFVMSVCGVMLGVMLLVIVESVMGGFGETYRKKIVDTSGHLQIKTNGVMYDADTVLNLLSRQPEIKGAAPFAGGVVMLQNGSHPAFPFVRGIDINLESTVISIDKFLVVGKIDDLDDDSVFLSSSLATSINARMGSTVDVYTPIMLEKLKSDEVLLPRELNVTGIYQTGWNDFDSNTMIVTLRLMQDLYNLSDAVHGISIRLHDGVDEFKFAETISLDLPEDYRAVTWMEMYQDFLWVLQLEKNLMFFLLIFIVLVAAFVIAIAQLLTVIRKTREIGLLSAIGARPIHLMACFCFQGFFIGVCGTILGIISAMTALHFRNGIIDWFAGITGSREALEKFYQFSELPVHYSMTDFLVISISALVLSTLAGLVPAWRASRLNPADALRNE